MYKEGRPPHVRQHPYLSVDTANRDHISLTGSAVMHILTSYEKHISAGS
jgi:hypothetical protein